MHAHVEAPGREETSELGGEKRHNEFHRNLELQVLGIGMLTAKRIRTLERPSSDQKNKTTARKRKQSGYSKDIMAHFKLQTETRLPKYHMLTISRK